MMDDRPELSDATLAEAQLVHASILGQTDRIDESRRRAEDVIHCSIPNAERIVAVAKLSQDANELLRLLIRYAELIGWEEPRRGGSQT